MKATREQVLAMAREAFDLIEGDDDLNCHAEREALVHLAQQFTLDQLRKRGADYYIEATPLFILPETLE